MLINGLDIVEPQHVGETIGGVCKLLELLIFNDSLILLLVSSHCFYHIV